MQCEVRLGLGLGLRCSSLVRVWTVAGLLMLVLTWLVSTWCVWALQDLGLVGWSLFALSLVGRLVLVRLWCWCLRACRL